MLQVSEALLYKSCLLLQSECELSSSIIESTDEVLTKFSTTGLNHFPKLSLLACCELSSGLMLALDLWGSPQTHFGSVQVNCNHNNSIREPVWGSPNMALNKKAQEHLGTNVCSQK